MTHDDWHPVPFSADARAVFSLLSRRGGCMRIGPLRDAAHLPDNSLIDALNELAQRSWVKIGWRYPRHRLPPGLPECWRSVERITTTSFGRWRYSVTWPEY